MVGKGEIVPSFLMFMITFGGAWVCLGRHTLNHHFGSYKKTKDSSTGFYALVYLYSNSFLHPENTQIRNIVVAVLLQ